MGSPTGKQAMGNRRTRAQVMQSVHHRLNELAVRCDKLQARHASLSIPDMILSPATQVNVRHVVSQPETGVHGHLARQAGLATNVGPDATCCNNQAAMQPCSSLSSRLYSHAAETHHDCSLYVKCDDISPSQQQSVMRSCQRRSAGITAACSPARQHQQLFAERQDTTQLSHKDVLQQGIVQLQQQLARERQDNIAAEMHHARALFVQSAPCRCY